MLDTLLSLLREIKHKTDTKIDTSFQNPKMRQNNTIHLLKSDEFDTKEI